MALSLEKIQIILEAALFASDQPLSLSAMQNIFKDDDFNLSNEQLRQVLKDLKAKYADGGIELKEVASGFRLQTKAELSPWLAKLWQERPPRYSRALLETLVIIAYKQPVTRAEIESIRGVAISSQIIKTLQEREWIKILGYREMPGKPAIFGTTKAFLDYFNLKTLAELPTLTQFTDISETIEKKSHQMPMAIDNAANNNTTTEELSEVN